jgi:hypothetical protein
VRATKGQDSLQSNAHAQTFNAMKVESFGGVCARGP